VSKKIIVIGGGIVGISTATQLVKRFPHLSITVIEKETELAQHQTGHNSGVIHAGVYYAPDSLKAKMCKAGALATIAFCQQHNIAFEQCGKMIVASDDLAMQRLEALQARCILNNLNPQRLSRQELIEREPNIVGLGAIFVPSSGIVNYRAITEKMAEEFQNLGGRLVKATKVLLIKDTANGVSVQTTDGDHSADFAVVCGGLHADRLAAMCGVDLDFRIVPFRGEYYRLPASKNNIVKHLIYPVPDPNLPFLGVHLTRMIGSYVTVGPNAVLGLSSEGYNWMKINPFDIAKLVAFPGFWQVIKKHRKSAYTEVKNSLFKTRYLKECQKYCPNLRIEDLQPYPAGVRAQAVLRDGTLAHDFLIRRTKHTLHVCNAPSPAATSAIPIGCYLTNEIAALF
jgi:(S)-2-hydroxyglutarate dehydrogenase